MLTIFAIPKAFVGHIEVIQRNAVASWSRLTPTCQVILCGNEHGTREVAAEMGALHIEDIAINEYGTPMLDSVFGAATAAASENVLCYVNADIMLMDDFLKARSRIRHTNFLMVGQRHDVDLREPWSFTTGWQQQLREKARREGALHPPGGSDFFAFPRGSSFAELPPLAVGRAGWDNWLIYNARRSGASIIDITGGATVVHQNHDYAHIPRGQGHSYEGPETDANRATIGGGLYEYTLSDATHLLFHSRLIPALQSRHLRRRRETLTTLSPGASRLKNLVRR